MDPVKLECGHPVEDADGADCVSCTASLISARMIGEVQHLPDDDVFPYIMTRLGTLLDEAGYPGAARRSREANKRLSQS